MNIKNENIFMPSGCLNWEALKKYQQGGFSDEIRADIDAHILKCPFCHEALEGFNIVPNIDEQEVLMNSMKKDLEQTIQHNKAGLLQKSKSNQRVRILAAAASILLLAGVFTIYNYVLRPVNEQVAEEFINTNVLEEKPIEYSVDRDIPVNDNAGIAQNKPAAVLQVEMEAEEDYSSSKPSSPSPHKKNEVSQNIVETKISSSMTKELVSDTGLSEAGLALPVNALIYQEELDEEIATRSFETSKKENKTLIRGVSATRSAPEMKSEDSMIVGGIEAMVLPRFESEKYADFDDYISNNLNYPSNVKKDGIEGEVIVEFTVSKNGKIKNPKIIKGASDDFDAEAIRLIKNSPDWIPANLNGVNEDQKIQWTIQFKKDPYK